jgi:hypothetical protein
MRSFIMLLPWLELFTLIQLGVETSALAALVVVIGPLRRRLAKWLLGTQPELYAPRRDDDSHTIIEGSYRPVDDDKMQ